MIRTCILILVTGVSFVFRSTGTGTQNVTVSHGELEKWQTAINIYLNTSACVKKDWYFMEIRFICLFTESCQADIFVEFRFTRLFCMRQTKQRKLWWIPPLLFMCISVNVFYEVDYIAVLSMVDTHVNFNIICRKQLLITV